MSSRDLSEAPLLARMDAKGLAEEVVDAVRHGDGGRAATLLRPSQFGVAHSVVVRRARGRPKAPTVAG